MAAVETARSRVFNKIAVALVLMATIVYLIPLYWIGSTAFKPRADSTTVPPTVFFKPEVTGFVKLFTKRVQLRKAVPEEKYNTAKWYEKLVYDAGQRIITSSPFLSRFWNSILIAVISTFLAVSFGTFTAYGFSRFKVAAENDWLFFILSTRMLPPVVVTSCRQVFLLRARVTVAVSPAITRRRAASSANSSRLARPSSNGCSTVTARLPQSASSPTSRKAWILGFSAHFDHVV